MALTAGIIGCGTISRFHFDGLAIHTIYRSAQTGQAQEIAWNF